MIMNIDYISGQSEWLRPHERTALSRREASLRLARARRIRDHFGTDAVRSKLPPLYVPVNPSPVSRRLAVIYGDRSALRRWSCSSCELRCERIHCVRKFSGRFNINIQGKTTFISPTFQKHETAETGVSDHRGRRKTAELHTSGAKRAETWRRGVKW